MAVGLVSAWGASAEAGVVNETEVQFSSHLSVGVSHALLLMGGTGSGGDGTGAGGGVVFNNLTIPAGTGSGGWGSFHHASEYGDSFAMLGISLGSGGELHLVVSLAHLTHINGTPFTDLFPGMSEQALIESLQFGTPLAEAFLRDQFGNLRTLDGQSTVVTAFSGAHDIGEISFSVVPGPSAAAMGFVPFAAFIRRGRRR